jgi:uncharacterized membrane protein
METGRLETFADGVFAIAATLLILNVRLIPTTGCAPLSCQILHAWPSYVAYVVSFLTIGIIWVNHHNVMRQIARADRTFLMITVLFLMVVAFIPFPTQLVAEHISGAFDDAQASTVTYGITLTMTAVLFNAVWFYAARGNRLLHADADPRVVRGISRTFVFGPWTYAAITLVAAISPKLGAVGFALFALFWVIESSVFGRDQQTQEAEP